MKGSVFPTPGEGEDNPALGKRKGGTGAPKSSAGKKGQAEKKESTMHQS